MLMLYFAWLQPGCLLQTRTLVKVNIMGARHDSSVQFHFLVQALSRGEGHTSRPSLLVKNPLVLCVLPNVLVRYQPGSRSFPAMADLPRGIPATKAWHVERPVVTEEVREHLALSGSSTTPGLVGLVGPSGAGKTTVAAMTVRNAVVRQFFCQGMLWLSVGEHAMERVPTIMSKLATKLWEQIFGKTERSPVQAVIFGADTCQDSKDEDGASDRNAEDGAGYIAKLVRKHNKRCLVVADNVCESEVVEELKKTGLWVLFTTQHPAVAATAGVRGIHVDQVCKEEAEQVLRHRAELDSDARLPDAAYEIMDLCQYTAMDLAFVGRWGVVRHRKDEQAWKKVFESIQQQRTSMPQASVRSAILQAGFEQLGVENPQLKELYLSLAVLPKDLIFDVPDAAVLLYGDNLSDHDHEATKELIQTLRRWAILDRHANVDRHTNDGYRVHDVHAKFVKERIAGDTVGRDKAVTFWRKHISSLDAVRSTSTDVLQKLWRAVEAVDGCPTVRPYHAELERMDTSDLMYVSTLEAIARFCLKENDVEEASVLYKRLLPIQEADQLDLLETLENLGALFVRQPGEWRTEEAGGYLRRALKTREEMLGPHHPSIAWTLHHLSMCARHAGRFQEAEEISKREIEIRRGQPDKSSRRPSENVAPVARGGRWEIVRQSLNTTLTRNISA